MAQLGEQPALPAPRPFVRIGVPFALLVLVVSVFLVSWLMPV